jgi:hypothetical protein
MADRCILLAKQSKKRKAYQAKVSYHMKKESKESREPNYGELRLRGLTNVSYRRQRQRRVIHGNTFEQTKSIHFHIPFKDSKNIHRANQMSHTNVVITCVDTNWWYATEALIKAKELIFCMQRWLRLN